MSGDLRDGGRGGEPTLADELLADPGFLVTADPERVVALLDAASGPAARLAAVVYRASARAHRDADATTRRQILAVDAARFGDRDLLTSSVRGKETTVVVDGRPVEVSLAEQGGPRVLDPSTGELLGTLANSAKSGPHYCVESVTIGGRPYVIAGDDGVVTVWDLSTRELVGELGSDGDDLQSWAVVTLDGRPHVVTCRPSFGMSRSVVATWASPAVSFGGHGTSVSRSCPLQSAANPCVVWTSRRPKIAVFGRPTPAVIGRPCSYNVVVGRCGEG